MLFARLCARLIDQGRLCLIDVDGRRHVCGEGGSPSATVRLHDRAVARSLVWNPALALGEAYVDGRLTVEEGTLYDFLDLCMRCQGRLEDGPLYRLRQQAECLIRAFHQYNPVGLARAHAHHHYDLSDTLYDLFLDRDRQYSCAYFTHPHDDLDQAQEDKKRRIAAKLLLEPGQRVLDIGSGWGGMALHLAEAGAREVVGVTLAEEQVKASRARAERRGLGNRVRFDLADYRDLDGRFDRIVSVGMFEHVGVRHYQTFFDKVRDLLTDDGVALLHSIGRMEGPGRTNPWIRKYIFPGGYSPALSEVLARIERSGLWATDIEILRLHYARTLRLWRQRFMAQRERVQAIYDERFCRMWEFYLTAAELAFRRQDHMVFQIQLARRRDAVPLTRDYLGEREHARELSAWAAD